MHEFDSLAPVALRAIVLLFLALMVYEAVAAIRRRIR